MLSRYGEFLDNAVWGILLLLLVPAGFAVTSWNSLPGSGLYGIRQTMEKVLVAVAPGSQAKGQLYVSFTARGARDAVQVLSDNGSTAGLAYLNAHVTAAKENIEKAPDPKVRAKLARQYIETLREANATLEQQKQRMSGTAPRRVATPTGSSRRTTTAPTSRPGTPTAAVTGAAPPPDPGSENEPPPDPVGEIEETQEQIEETIDDLEEQAAAMDVLDEEQSQQQAETPTSTSTSTPTPTTQQESNNANYSADQNDENKDKKNDKDHDSGDNNNNNGSGGNDGNGGNGGGGGSN